MDVLCQILQKFYFTSQQLQNFIPLQRRTKICLEKTWEDMVGGLFIVTTRIAVVEKTFIRDSTNWCRTNDGIGANQLHPLSTGLYVSNNANWSVHKMGTRFGIWQTYTASKQNEEFWKHSHVILSASQTTV